MLLCSDDIRIDFEANIIEPDINREASDYLKNNYHELIAIVKKTGVKEEKAQDLVHDVFISLVEAESEGNGFDMEFGSRHGNADSDDVNIMDVAQFVISRIKNYAKNAKYRTDIVEANCTSVNEVVTYDVEELDSNGNCILDKDGKPKTKRVSEKSKVKTYVTLNAASFNDGGGMIDGNDDFQKAYAVAATADMVDDSIEMLSIRNQIDYCIEVCELHGFNILNVFKNIDKIADMLGDMSKKKKSADSVFSKLSELANYHDEFGASLMEVLTFSSKNKAIFDGIIASY